MSAIPRDLVADVHALSPVQQGMYFHTVLEPELAPYVTQSVWRIQGEVDAAVFERAWQELVARHPALRSVFRQAKRQPVQIVLKSQPLALPCHDWMALDADAQRRALVMLAHEELAPFRIGDGPLFRLALVRLGGQEWRLIWTFHHIILDGLTVGLLLESLCRTYDALAAGAALPPSDAPSFGDYVLWLSRQDPDAAMRFWTGQLQGIAAPTPLPYDRRPATVSGRTHRATHAWISRETTQAIAELARRQRVTMSRVVQAAWAILLARFSGEPDVVFGLTVGGRPSEIEGVERIVGPFINTVPVRVSLRDDPRFGDVLQALQRQFFDVDQYCYVSVADIQARTPIRPPARLFDSAVNVHPPVDWNGFRAGTFAIGVASDAGPPVGRTNYDLMVDVALFDSMGVTMSYVEEAFDAGTIDTLQTCLRSVLESIAERGAAVRVSQLDAVSADARARLLDGFNDAGATPAFDGGIAARVERQAALTPDAIAVVDGAERVTYGQLNARADRLAAWLRRSGIGREDAVALCGERGAGLIAAVLGVLESGAAFVPLDPVHPDARLTAMLAAARPKAIVYGPESAARAATLSATLPERPVLVGWHELSGSGDAAEQPDARPSIADARGLACVFFTSGSTGVPKGAMVEHAGLHNHVAAKVAALGLDRSSVVAQNASSGFDICVWQMLAALTVGGRVVVYDDETAFDPERLATAMARDGVTVLETVPTLLDPFTDAASRVSLPALRRLISNAELLPVPLCRRWVERFPGVPLVNTYGATECSDDTTHHVQVEPPPDGVLRVPVGRPIPGARIYVLDAALRPVPCGAAGEIAMGGVAVGRGYLNDPAATALTFVPDPYGSPGARMYRSGDEGRWTGDGVLEFLGRRDDQVKVRGHRVELGEIQAAVLAHPGVRQAFATVGARATGEPYLAAYWSGDAGVDPVRLRAALGEALPPYMMPSLLMRLDALPLTPNGKVDRAALPAPSDDEWRATYVAPDGPIEPRVAAVWSEVLGLERIGATDNFFELGGQSLKTLQVRLRLVQEFGVDIPMRAIFRHQTVQAQAAAIAALLAEQPAGLTAIPRLPDAGTYRLSRAQRRLWFMHQLNPADTSYVLLEPLSLEGELDRPAFERAWTELVTRHESLRTAFVEIDGEPMQRILPPETVGLAHLDLSSLTVADRDAELRRLLTVARETPFTLETPPVRATLIRLAPGRHLLAVAVHHLLSDAWSGEILLRDFLELYRAARAGEPPQLPALPVRYVDYAAWQHDRLAAGASADDEAYWMTMLGGDRPTLDLAGADREPSAAAVHTRTFRLDAQAAAGLREVTTDGDVTPFMLRLALLKAALARATSADDLLIGAPVAGRDRPEVDALVGFFVNLLAFRTSLAGNPSFAEVVRRVRQTCHDAYAHQDYPFDDLVQRLNPTRQAGRVPIFDILFTTFANGGARDAGGGLTVAEASPGVERGGMVWTGASMAVTLFALCREEADGALSWSLSFDAGHVGPAGATRIASRIESVMRSIAGNPLARISAHGAADPAERARIVRQWNATASGYPSASTIHAIVEAHAAATPDAVAVLDGPTEWTYAAIDARANRLARHLLARGVEPGTLVATLLERSADLVVAQLAILKAGAAYLSLSLDEPRERLRFMLADGNVRVAIAAQAVEDASPAAGAIDWVSLARDAAAIDAASPAALPHCGYGGSLSHVMYTSGSTGRPKGVMIPHRGVTRLLCAWPDVPIRADDRIAQMSNCQFDGVTLEIWGALLNGACAVVIPRDTVLSPPGLAAALAAHRITLATLTPVLFNQMARETPACFNGLRCLFSGGDVMSPEAARRVLEHGAPGQLRNGYGPTENSMFTTTHLVTEAATGGPAIPIGRPVPHTQVYVVDAQLQLVGVGVPGELCTGGAGLADGYWGRPDLTAAAFVPDPFSGVRGARLYRTGDLARWRADGTLEFLGRADHQVKIRGQRIELGEVEAVLRTHPAIVEATVVVRERQDDRRLAAYVVPSPGAAIAPDAVRRFVAERLPAVMVPAWIVPLDALPLTPGRKIDRRALPDPADDRAVTGVEYVAPRTPVEIGVADVWSAVLGVGAVGVHDSFFDLGGHSLTSVLLRTRLSGRFAIDLPLRAVFEHQTVAAQAREIEGRLATGAPVVHEPLPVLPPREHYALSHAQRGLWFLQRLHPDDTTYTVVGPLPLQGALDRDAFVRALDALVARHPALRTSFALVGQEPVQRIDETFRPVLIEEDISGLDVEARRERLRAIAHEIGGTPFDLSHPPVRTALLGLTADRHLFMLAMHHSLTDGWSWRVLVDDLTELYRADRAGESPRLAPAPARYVDFAAWQNERLASGALGAAERYWVERLADAPPPLTFADAEPTDTAATDHTHVESVVCDAAAIDRLQHLGRSRGLTPLMTRLAILKAFLARATGQDDLVVGTPVSGRDHPDTERVVGYFVNLLPMRTSLAGDPSFVDVIERVKRTCLEAYEHQGYPFDVLVQRLNPARRADQLPIVQLIFASDEAVAPATVGELTVGASGDRPAAVDQAGWSGSANGVRIVCAEQGSRLVWTLAYPADMLSQSAARRLLRQFAGFVDDLARRPEAPLSATELRPEFGLSLAQQAVWRQLRGQDARAQVTSLRVTLRGSLDPERWRAALERAVARHDALRAAFHVAGEAIVQQIAPSPFVAMPIVDLSGTPDGERTERLAAIERELLAAPFPLASPPLVRSALVRLDGHAHLWLLCAHCLVADGPALLALMEETAEGYDGGGDEDLPAAQYGDVVAWQEGRTASGAWTRQAEHWRRQLQSPPAMALPTEGEPRAGAPPDLVYRPLDPGVVSGLRRLATGAGTSVEALCASVFSALVARLSSQRDVLLGLRLSSRPRPFEGVLGAFAHSVPLRITIGEQRRLMNIAREMADRLRDADTRREFPLDLGAARRDGDGVPLRVVFDRLVRRARTAGGIHVAPGLPREAPGDEDLAFVVVTTDEGVGIALRYRAGTFAPATIGRWADYLAAAVTRAGANPDVPVDDLDFVPDLERQWLLHDVNATATAYPAAATVHGLFAEEARRCPDAAAVVDGDQHWTYRELNEQANRLAWHLRALGVEPGALVATCLPRSAALVAAQLAILKTGAAYLPLDPDDPAERLGFMIADSGARIAVATSALRGRLNAAPACAVVCLDDDADDIATAPDADLPESAGAESLAYLMYTSGSTGRPKGAMIAHRGIVRLVRETELVSVRPDDRVAHLANCSFDAATFELWGALLNGACLVVFSRHTVLAPRALAAGLEDHRVTIAFFTAALFSRLAAEVPECFGRLRHVLTGGEVMNPRATRAVLEHAAPGRLTNGYGPTENSVFTTAHTVTDVPAATIPIGRPVSNTQVYIVDRRLRPVGVGIAGELCAGGAGVGHGYRGRPASTAERFVPDPFSGIPGARLYCTGDLARWRADGTIEFVGRADQQVKIHGHRIELGEIEAVLRQHTAVSDAAVVVHERGTDARVLVAYVVPAPGAAAPLDALRRHAAAHLPGYMVPSTIVPLPVLPLTATGKVDRRALPDVADARAALDVEFVAPRTPLESEIAAVWRTVLGVDRVGVHDNFFDLGGDSVLCIVAVSQLAERGVTTSPRRVFEHPTVAELALAGVDHAATPHVPDEPAAGAVPLLPIQHFFFEQRLEHSHHWNAGTLLAGERLDAGALEQVLQALLDHHDALRMRFTPGADGWTQFNPPPGERVTFEVVDLADAAQLTDACDRVQAALDYVRGPVFRAALFRLPDGTDRLLVIAHHLVLDMVSGRILFDDLARAYEQAARGEAIVLRRRTTSMRRWAETLAAHAPARLPELPSWQAIVDARDRPLPIDHDTGGNTMESLAFVRVEVDADTTRTLLTRARAVLGLDLQEVLIGALARAIGEWAEIPALTLLVEGHGREDIADGIDLSRTIGWCTAMHPVRVPTGGGVAPAEHLRDVSAALRAAPDRGLGYGLLRYTLQRPELAGRALPEVTFNYHGQFSDTDLGGERLRIASERGGTFTATRGTRFSLLNAECSVRSGRLWAALLYSRHKHRRDTIEAILDRFTHALRDAAAACEARRPVAEPPPVLAGAR